MLAGNQAESWQLKPSREGYEIRIVRDLVYRELARNEDAGKKKNRLDLYVPTGVTAFPVMLFVHGGAWIHGDKAQRAIYGRFGAYWARRGVGTAVVNYRLSPGVQHPEHVKDVASALAWTRANIKDYGGNADQLFLAGHSAGGHLISLLTCDPCYLQSEHIPIVAVKGVIPISGVYQIHDSPLFSGILNGAAGGNEKNNLGETREKFLTSIFGKDKETRKLASPITHVRPGLPPFLLLYADKDLPLLGVMARDFDRSLRRHRNSARVVEIKDRSHLSILTRSTQDDDPVALAIQDFVAGRLSRSDR